MKARGHSLWLMPSGGIYERMYELIQGLSREYEGPLFEPHVTLLGEVMFSEEDIIRKTKQLLDRQHPFPITLTSIDYQEFYFRSLFVKVKKIPELLTLQTRAKEIFAMQDKLSYMPHFSLLYGNFPKKVKSQIVEILGVNQDLKFVVDRVNLYKTDGEASTWHRVKEFPLI